MRASLQREYKYFTPLAKKLYKKCGWQESTKKGIILQNICTTTMPNKEDMPPPQANQFIQKIEITIKNLYNRKTETNKKEKRKKTETKYKKISTHSKNS